MIRPRLRVLAGATLLVVTLSGCRQREFNSESSTKDAVPQCQGEVQVASFANRRAACYQGTLEPKRHISPWIPCNEAKVFSHAEDPRDTNAANQTWLKNSRPFGSEEVFLLVTAPDKPNPAAAGFPVLTSPIHKAMVDIFREARESIFFDVFLLGGRWGVEIARELINASRRGVKVMVVRDVENPFFFRGEIDPLMSGLIGYGHRSENFVAMRAQIHRRPSFLPLGMDNVIKPFFRNTEANNTPLLQSDHSKIIVVDGFSRNPKMLVGSKNMTDFGAAVNFDEVVRVDGPAAGAAMLSYIPDVAMAHDLARAEKQLSAEDDAYVQGWLDEARARLSGAKPSPALAVGRAEVRIAENNGDDSVRNTEHTVINLLESARRSIKFYGMGMIPYNLEFTKAIARAVGRGVRVQPLLDSRLGLLTGTAFLVQVAEHSGGSAGGNSRLVDGRWRTLLPHEKMPDGRPDLNQQQHTKTIIIDDEVVFVGSANQDAATFEGDFREFSVAVRGAPAVAQAVGNFNRVFEDGAIARPLEEYLEREKGMVADALDVVKRRALLDYLRVRGARVGLVEAERSQAPCP